MGKLLELFWCKSSQLTLCYIKFKLQPWGACSLKRQNKMLFFIYVIIGVTLFHCYLTWIISLIVRQPSSEVQSFHVLHRQGKVQLSVLISLLNWSTALGFSLHRLQAVCSTFISWFTDADFLNILVWAGMILATFWMLHRQQQNFELPCSLAASVLYALPCSQQ